MDLTQNPTPRHRLVSPLPQRPLGVTSFADGGSHSSGPVATATVPPCRVFPSKLDVVVRAYHPSSRRWSEGNRSLPLPTQRVEARLGYVRDWLKNNRNGARS